MEITDGSCLLNGVPFHYVYDAESKQGMGPFLELDVHRINAKH